MLNTRELVQFGVSSSMPNRVIQGDNLPVLECWQDRALDTVYLDPPFGTGTTKRSSARTRYEDPLADPEVFVTWLTPRLVHARRALRDTGSLFVHLDYRAVHYVKVALDKLFGRKNFINEIVWCYSVGGRSSPATRSARRCTQTAAVCSRAASSTTAAAGSSAAPVIAPTVR
jgi:site-specific DNA-methyltransferase (adenine-specific)